MDTVLLCREIILIVMVIDLHGVYHRDVEGVLERELLVRDNRDGWEIITGMSPHMQGIVTKWLDWHGFGWYVPHHNPGRVHIVD